MPNITLAAVEKAGLMSKFTHNVVDLAISQLAELNKTFPDIHMSINISADVLYDLDFPDQLSAKMDAKNLAHNQLVLEISESIATNEILGPIDALLRLGLRDFRLSMDDFGTGHFSLLRLLRMPFSELKLDKFIISECKESNEARTIVEAMIGLAKSLKLQACAVGIEDKATLNILRGLGCELAQGNYFSDPVKSEDLSAIITSINKTQW